MMMMMMFCTVGVTDSAKHSKTEVLLVQWLVWDALILFFHATCFSTFAVM